MMLNNRNVYISILETNGENIITTLNRLLYISGSRHLKNRDMHIMSELLEVKHGLGAGDH